MRDLDTSVENDGQLLHLHLKIYPKSPVFTFEGSCQKLRLMWEAWEVDLNHWSLLISCRHMNFSFEENWSGASHPNVHLLLIQQLITTSHASHVNVNFFSEPNQSLQNVTLFQSLHVNNDFVATNFLETLPIMQNTTSLHFMNPTPDPTSEQDFWLQKDERVPWYTRIPIPTLLLTHWSACL